MNYANTMRATFALMALVAGLLAAPFTGAQAAPYEFELTVGDYAKETGFYQWAEFRALIENTGTEPDTIDLVLTEHNPPNWYSDICIRGKCYTGPAYINLAPGQIDTVIVNVRAKGVEEMFSLTLTGTMRHDAGQVRDETFAAFANIPSILIVDDDAGASYETYVEAAIDSAGYDARTWDADSLGRPGPVQLSSYWAVFWTTADGSATYLTNGDEQDMMTYLDGGGNLLLASMEFLSSRPGATTFTDDYLHVASWTDDTGSTVAAGFAGDPISNGMTLSLMAGPFVPNNSDNMVVTAPTDSIFRSGIGTNGLKVDEGGHKVVFLSFPFEVVIPNAPYPNNQKTLISRVIDWFDPAVAGIGDVVPGGMVVSLGQNSPNPFSDATRISFAVPRDSKRVSLVVYNIRGRVVRTLVSGRPSVESVVWNGTDEAGRPVASGMYFYKLTADGGTAFRKMLLLK
jgi:hypothetical protein